MLKLLPLALLLVLLGACGSPNPEHAPVMPDVPFRDDGSLTFLRDGEELVNIEIEVAADDSSRARGLMQRSSLPDREGMLFLFEQEQPQSFWMANTQVSLDLFFADADSVIVSIATYARPLSPDPVVSEAPAQFVIETAAGFADTWGIIEGDRVTWKQN